jgi:hypothetical protein
VLHAAGGGRGSGADERERRNDHCTDDCSFHALLLASMRLPVEY